MEQVFWNVRNMVSKIGYLEKDVQNMLSRKRELHFKKAFKNKTFGTNFLKHM